MLHYYIVFYMHIYDDIQHGDCIKQRIYST